MRILLTNDDGVEAPGIAALKQTLDSFAEVWVAAPQSERSVLSHCLTLHKPIRVKERGSRVFAVSGTPADCVYVAVGSIMKRHPPDVIVSGINLGENLAQDVYYSGTVGAARQGALMGFPSYAVSLALGTSLRPKKLHWESAAWALQEVIRRVPKMPFGVVMNINVPNRPADKLAGIRSGTLGFRRYGNRVIRRMDHRGHPYYWIGGRYQGYDRKKKNSDCAAVEAGYVSVTPLQLECTDMTFLQQGF